MTLASKGSDDRSFVLPLLHQKQNQQPGSRGSTASERPTPSADGAASASASARAGTQAASGEMSTRTTRTATTTTNTTTTATPASRARLVTVLFLYCASGTALTLANKLAVKLFPYPNLILVIQNGMAVATLALGSCTVPLTIGRMPRLSWPLVRLWVPLTVTFSLMLVSSLLALQEVSAVTLIVIRNVTSLSVAGFEFVCLGTALQWQSAGALLGILGGAVMYSLHDITFSPVGYSWLLLNLLSTSAYQVWVKRVIASDAGKKIGALGMSYVNNLLSLPVLVAVALASGEVPGFLGIESGAWSGSGAAGSGSRSIIGSGAAGSRLGSGVGSISSGGGGGGSSSSSGFTFSSSSSSSVIAAAAATTARGLTASANKAAFLDGASVTLLLGSGALGICLSVTAFMLNALISATSMMVANNVNKFFVIMLSECFIQRTLDDVSSLGVAAVMLFGWLYGEASKRAAAVKIATKPSKAALETEADASSSRKKNISNTNKLTAGTLGIKREPLSNV